MKAEKLAADHWAYLEGLMQTHNVDETAVGAIGFHYKTAFVHGYKHGEESRWIWGMLLTSIVIILSILLFSGVLCRAEEKTDWSKFTVTGSGSGFDEWKPSYKIQFSDKTGKIVGTLYLEDPMRFEGKVDESAKVFFDYFVKLYGRCKEVGK